MTLRNGTAASLARTENDPAEMHGFEARSIENTICEQ
jgi:hypothetical protein